MAGRGKAPAAPAARSRAPALINSQTQQPTSPRRSQAAIRAAVPKNQVPPPPQQPPPAEVQPLAGAVDAKESSEISDDAAGDVNVAGNQKKMMVNLS